MNVTPVMNHGSMPDHNTRTSQPTFERLVDPIARARLGVVTTSTLTETGIARGMRAAELRRGGLVRLRRGVYRPSGTRLTSEGELRAACEACGPQAVASHRSALWLWGLTDEPDEHEVSVPSVCHARPPGVLVHRSTDLTDQYRFTRKSVPTTTPARAVLDGAAVVSRYQLGQIVEQALVDKLVSVATLRTILDELGCRGRRGAGALRHVLDVRALGDVRAESRLEPLMARLLRDARLGPVLFQSTIELDGHRFRPDFQLPDVRVVVEVDGLSAHGSRVALDGDLARQNSFIRHGWLVLRYTSTHLRRPALIAREIADVVAKRRIELGIGTDRRSEPGIVVGRRSEFGISSDARSPRS